MFSHFMKHKDVAKLMSCENAISQKHNSCSKLIGFIRVYIFAVIHDNPKNEFYLHSTEY